jgi:hypothetical protein
VLSVRLRLEPFSEVDLTRGGIGDDLGRGARDDELAAIDQVSEVGDRERVADVVVGDDDSDPALLEGTDLVLEIGDRDRVGGSVAEPLRRHTEYVVFRARLFLDTHSWCRVGSPAQGVTHGETSPH